MNKSIDRRGNPRFRPKFNTIVECHDSKRGLVTDISREGLAFKYYDFGFESKKNTNAPLQVTVFHDDDFMVENLQCKIVNDCRLLPRAKKILKKMRKCCLKFDELASNQKAHLEYFINNCTAGNIDSTTAKG